MNENLFSALSLFSEEIDLDNEQRFGLLTSNIKGGYIDLDKLKNELISSLSDIQFDWFGLAKKAELLINLELYNNFELANYIKGWLWDYLYPEKILSKSDVESLAMEINTLLQNFKENDGWMYSYTLWEILTQKEKFSKLEYYNLWKIPFEQFNIERKIDNGKDREIGYLRGKK